MGMKMNEEFEIMKKTRMKRIAALLLVLAMTTSLVACTSAPQKQTPSQESSAQAGTSSGVPSDSVGISHAAEGYPEINPKIAEMEPMTLEIWLPSDQGTRPMFSVVKELFEESYPNITLSYNSAVSWEEIPAKVKLAVNSGVSPDMASHHPFVAGAQNFAEPLDDLWEEWGAEEEFLPSAMEDVTWQGVKYGVPFTISSICLFYNEQIFNEMGVTEIPTTLAEVRETAKALTTPEHYGFVCHNNPWGLFGIVAAEGYDLLDEDGNPTLNDPGVVETLTTYIEMATVDKSAMVPPPQEIQDFARAMYGSGRAAMYISGTWEFGMIPNEYPDVWAQTKLARLPGKANSGVAGGGGQFVPLGAKNREAAFEFMKWLTATPFIVEFCKDYGMFPVKTAQLEDPAFNTEEYQPFIESLPNVRPYAFEAFPQAADAFEQATRAGYDGGDFATMMDSAQKVAEEEILG